MSIICELRLNQPSAGIKVGADEKTETWLIVKLRQNSLMNLLEYEKLGYGKNRLSEWTDDGYSAWGNYFIVGNYKYEPNSGFTIGSPGGSSGSTTSKIWRYNVKEQRLYFEEASMQIGGGLSNGESELSVKDELVLFNALILGNKIVPFGTSDYTNGFVNVKSWIKPFEQRVIFWKQE